MKKATIASLTALMLSSAGIFAQDTPTSAFTTPAGYVTHTLSEGFNMIGLTLHEPILASGVLGAPSGQNLPTDVSDLGSVLGTSGSGSIALIEIIEGDNLGLIIEVGSWSSGDFTGIGGLDSSLEGDRFQVRLASSISDLFGADNSVGFLEGDLQTADLVWIANGTGGFDQYYYSPGNPNAFPVPVTEGWKDSVGADASDVRINYLDGMFIQRRGTTDLDLVVTGAVKTETTLLDVRGGAFNYYSGIFPASTTLSDSNLDQTLTHGTATTGDVVWLPSGPGAFDRFTYQDADPNAFPVPVTEGWKDSVGNDASNVEMTSGFIIQRRGGDVNASYDPNVLYNNL